MKPRIQFDPALPISAKRDEIRAAVEKHPVVIVCGETGSGKTTQIPKILLEMGRGATGRIGHTQPRRIAARSVAARIAEELKTELGSLVGYKVRFNDRVRADTVIKLMTDGILLAETQGDPQLRAYDTIILDEAHERSLNIDFLLGFLKKLLEKRHDLKLVIASATIDAEKFSRHFDGAPVIEVSGRLYPVEVRYRPVEGDKEDTTRQEEEQALAAAVGELRRGGQGDVLVFLPGEREIREAADVLRKAIPGAEILPLYSRLSVAEQDRVFRPGSAQRVVLAIYGPLPARLATVEDGGNPKGRLQELVQAVHGNDALRYEVTRTDGADHAREYEVAVFLHDHQLGTGRGSSKKLAEESAARVALANL